MKDVAEAICVVAVLAFLAFTMPTCSGCGEIGPSPAHATVTAQRAAPISIPGLTSGPSFGAVWEDGPSRSTCEDARSACEDALVMANDTVVMLLKDCKRGGQ